MVLHRVLAGAARTFLLNDMGDELVDEDKRCETIDALSVLMRPRPLWAQSAAYELDGVQRRTDATERIHQSRVALRRIRSNLRTFRLLLDPTWGTALRAELAWYGNRLGELRDLHIISEIISGTAPQVMGAADVDRLNDAVSTRVDTALAAIAAERGGARRFNLTEQMMVLWDGPAFKAKASKPAGEVLPVMLRRAWHDLRSASRRARKDPADENLHKVRIRVKDLRYGCNTVALIEGGPARKTAKAAEDLQIKLGDFHDALLFDRLAPGPGRPAPRPGRAGRCARARAGGRGQESPQGLEGLAQGRRTQLEELARLSGRPGRARRRSGRVGGYRTVGRGVAAYAVTRFTPMWSTPHNLMPPRMPAVLSMMVTSASRFCRLTRLELPPPM